MWRTEWSSEGRVANDMAMIDRTGHGDGCLPMISTEKGTGTLDSASLALSRIRLSRGRTPQGRLLAVMTSWYAQCEYGWRARQLTRAIGEQTVNTSALTHGIADGEQERTVYNIVMIQ